MAVEINKGEPDIPEGDTGPDDLSGLELEDLNFSSVDEKTEKNLKERQRLYTELKKIHEEEYLPLEKSLREKLDLGEKCSSEEVQEIILKKKKEAEEKIEQYKKIKSNIKAAVEIYRLYNKRNNRKKEEQKKYQKAKDYLTVLSKNYESKKVISIYKAFDETEMKKSEELEEYNKFLDIVAKASKIDSQIEKIYGDEKVQSALRESAVEDELTMDKEIEELLVPYNNNQEENKKYEVFPSKKDPNLVFIGYPNNYENLDKRIFYMAIKRGKEKELIKRIVEGKESIEIEEANIKNSLNSEYSRLNGNNNKDIKMDKIEGTYRFSFYDSLCPFGEISVKDLQKALLEGPINLEVLKKLANENGFGELFEKKSNPMMIADMEENFAEKEAERSKAEIEQFVKETNDLVEVFSHILGGDKKGKSNNTFEWLVNEIKYKIGIIDNKTSSVKVWKVFDDISIQLPNEKREGIKHFFRNFPDINKQAEKFKGILSSLDMKNPLMEKFFPGYTYVFDNNVLNNRMKKMRDLYEKMPESLKKVPEDKPEEENQDEEPLEEEVGGSVDQVEKKVEPNDMESFLNSEQGKELENLQRIYSNYEDYIENNREGIKEEKEKIEKYLERIKSAIEETANKYGKNVSVKLEHGDGEKKDFYIYKFLNEQIDELNEFLNEELLRQDQDVQGIKRDRVFTNFGTQFSKNQLETYGNGFLVVGDKMYKFIKDLQKNIKDDKGTEISLEDFLSKIEGAFTKISNIMSNIENQTNEVINQLKERNQSFENFQNLYIGLPDKDREIYEQDYLKYKKLFDILTKKTVGTDEPVGLRRLVARLNEGEE